MLQIHPVLSRFAYKAKVMKIWKGWNFKLLPAYWKK